MRIIALPSLFVHRQVTALEPLSGGDYEECRRLVYKTPVRASQETHYVSTTEPSRVMLFFTAVTIENAIFWDVTPRDTCKNRCFGGTYRLHYQGDKNRRAGNNVSRN
jgi:hypothetical protein